MIKKEEDSKHDIKSDRLKKNEDTSSEDEEMDEAELNWWEQENMQIATRGEKRWDTLHHNGVLFPPPYEPHGIPIFYEGVEFKMLPEEEEVATMFAVLKENDYYRNEIFRRNFFRSWREILDRRPHPIRRLELCDFEPIYQWHLARREKKLNRTKEEKKEAKMRADAEAEPYRWCVWDGRKEQVANFRVEPPDLFRGRGKHPLAGTLKARVMPEDITINISPDAKIPDPPAGHHWKAVQHDNTVTWLAMWRDNVTGNFKYVMLAPSSAVKGQSDLVKFETARKLKDHVETIRENYTRSFKSSDIHTAQRAVAMYFIDKLALRVGNEKGSNEADTVGCCSLRVEHLELKPDNVVKFDFLGKDSIRYINEVKVLPEVYALLARFTRGKRKDDDVFDHLTPTQLNDHLKSFMEGLSAKVFRTYNASITLDRWFKEKPVDPKSTIPEKLAYFNKANMEVAILCNHQKSVSKSFAKQFAQLTGKAQHTKRILDGLKKVRDTAKSKSFEAAVKEFFEEQDRVQYEWLDLYGTEEQKKEYAELVANREKPKIRCTSGNKKKSSTSKSKAKSAKKSKPAARKNGAKKGKSKSTKKTKKAVPKKASPKSKAPATKIKKEEADVPNGKTLASMASKKRPAKRPRAVKEEESEDDVPISAL
ncbi:unnamed protein product [Phytomonas sp. EM1]|nr:unnamed protein product [Phytomonas sp. EM1]|eukprot:CCW60738.1 unnamed protein product [Phytomonas sp. isolate EM1]